MPAARVTVQLIERALAAWQARGLTVGAVDVRPDGSIRISAAMPQDALEQPQTGESAWDAKIAKKGAR